MDCRMGVPPRNSIRNLWATDSQLQAIIDGWRQRGAGTRTGNRLFAARCSRETMDSRQERVPAALAKSDIAQPPCCYAATRWCGTMPACSQPRAVERSPPSV
jgi:hypothetical protein